VAANKGIPPFLILHIAGNPDTSAQARRLADTLQAAGISAKVVGRDTTHESLNDEIGAPDDPVTKEVFAFVTEALSRSAERRRTPQILMSTPAAGDVEAKLLGRRAF
jgi:arylformamidase